MIPLRGNPIPDIYTSVLNFGVFKFYKERNEYFIQQGFLKLSIYNVFYIVFYIALF